MSGQTEEIRHVADLVDRARISMLTTMTASGKHVSRPMAVQEVEFDGDLWFFCYDVDSAEYWESPSSKVRQLIGAARAAVTGDPDKFPGENRTVSMDRERSHR